ncbi:MAG: outer membrane protein assembly factor BamD [Limimaricola sp.]|uniref:outer membrane protein assembly factor BamD n=1 Tax=Limimaricola sp. TaxID=2211665 RepID=UPI001D99A917|nr:outer membrane protein assembly factor BamD [Limimaricola sp.]MBI1418567.1 outer membrane protein assembly factor BamD [Limimaricola sp.]
MAGWKSGLATRQALAAAFLAATVLGGCSNFDPKAPGALDNYSASDIYTRGEYELQHGKAKDAAFYFSEIERLYPYSSWAERGLIMEAFAYHKAADYDNTRAAAQRYLDNYPTGKDAAYAQYLLALSYYDQIDEVGRDQALTRDALKAFTKLIETYPDSEYARAATLKFDLAMDHLAAKEMEVGRYYLKRSIYGAAAARFRIVVEQFPTTSQTPEALYRLVEAYMALGLTDEAQTAGAILGHNFQSTSWYDDAYALLTGHGLQARSLGNNWLSAIYRQTVRGAWL